MYVRFLMAKSAVKYETYKAKRKQDKEKFKNGAG